MAPWTWWESQRRWQPWWQYPQLTQDQVMNVFARCGVRDIYSSLFGEWPGWSAFKERRWLGPDDYHLNVEGQRQLRKRFRRWLREERRRDRIYNVLVADSTFFTVDAEEPRYRTEEDFAAMGEMGFITSIMLSGTGFVRNGGFAPAIKEAIGSGELPLPFGDRVLVVTAGNDACCDEEWLYSETYLAEHVQWVREVLAPYTSDVTFVSVTDTSIDWQNWTPQ